MNELPLLGSKGWEGGREGGREEGWTKGHTTTSRPTYLCQEGPDRSMEEHHGAQHQSTAGRSTGTTAWMVKRLLAGAGGHGLLASVSTFGRLRKAGRPKQRKACVRSSFVGQRCVV